MYVKQVQMSIQYYDVLCNSDFQVHVAEGDFFCLFVWCLTCICMLYYIAPPFLLLPSAYL